VASLSIPPPLATVPPILNLPPPPIPSHLDLVSPSSENLTPRSKLKKKDMNRSKSGSAVASKDAETKDAAMGASSLSRDSSAESSPCVEAFYAIFSVSDSWVFFSQSDQPPQVGRSISSRFSTSAHSSIDNFAATPTPSNRKRRAPISSKEARQTETEGKQKHRLQGLRPLNIICAIRVVPVHLWQHAAATTCWPDGVFQANPYPATRARLVISDRFSCRRGVLDPAEAVLTSKLGAAALRQTIA
jgi:hypothetical protein